MGRDQVSSVVVESRKVARAREAVERQDQKNEMPQSSGNQCTARNSPFHPTVFEKIRQAGNILESMFL